MGTHVIVGAGAVGRATAEALMALGEEVIVVTRSGTPLADGRITSVAADASSTGSLAPVLDGAVALYNCANPPYHRWGQDWPPLAAALLDGARRSGAVLVTMSNLYGYGPVDHPMAPSDPLAATFTNGSIRAAMWREAKAAHDAGDVRATEARASDFFGPGTAATSHLGRALPRLVAGKRIRVLGDPDQPHSWTFVPDVGRTLAVLGTNERAWGRAWHVPSNPPATQRQMLVDTAVLAGVAAPRVSAIPDLVVQAVGVFSPMVRSLREVNYQFDAPFVIDASETESVFALTPTPLEPALTATLDALGRADRT